MLTQVKQLFGNREELLLPLVLDIANLVKIAGQRPFQRPTFSENEVPPSIQMLRRSFFSAKPHGFTLQKLGSADTTDEDESESIAKVTDITKLVVMNQHDDTLEVDEGTSIVKNITAPAPRRTERFVQYPNEKKLAQTYHERKLNMTAFNSTENQIDQDAVASEVSYAVALPQNITMEEMEDLALGSLRLDDDDYLMNDSSNGTASENLPTPEQLIARKRFRPPFSRSPPPQLSNRKEIEDCESFSGTICLNVKNYPK